MQGAERTWDDLWCKIRPAVMTIFCYFHMIVTIITLLVFVTVLNMLCAVSYRLIRVDWFMEFSAEAERRSRKAIQH